jgi:hypothetical protein
MNRRPLALIGLFDAIPCMTAPLMLHQVLSVGGVLKCRRRSGFARSVGDDAAIIAFNSRKLRQCAVGVMQLVWRGSIKHQDKYDANL